MIVNLQFFRCSSRAFTYLYLVPIMMQELQRGVRLTDESEDT